MNHDGLAHCRSKTVSASTSAAISRTEKGKRRKGVAPRRFDDCVEKDPFTPLATASARGLDRVGYRDTVRGGVGTRKTIREAEEFVWCTDLAVRDGADDGLGGHLASAHTTEADREGCDPRTAGVQRGSLPYSSRVPFSES